MAQLNYFDTVSLDTLPDSLTGTNDASVTISSGARLFMSKYSHQDVNQLRNGDNMGFTIVFGNFGENTWTQPTPNIVTLEDTITIASPMRLKLMDMSPDSDFELWIVSRDGVALTNPRQLTVCTTLNAGTYIIQIWKNVNNEYTPYFDVPCNSINVFSMMFQVRFPACPGCPDECSAPGITNGDFEYPPYETANVIRKWDVNLPQTGDPYAKTISTITLKNLSSDFQKIYNPISGDHFLLLKTDGPNSYTEVSQSFEVCPGDTIQGYSFFFTNEVSASYPDNATITIVDKNGDLVTTLFDKSVTDTPPSYGSTGWSYWSYTFSQGGIYTLRLGVTNARDSAVDSYLGADAIKIIKNQQN